MKRLVRSATENPHELRPTVDILGETVGGVEVVRIVEGNKVEYYWGSSSGLNVERRLGIHISEQESDESIVSTIDDLWMKILTRKESKPWMDYLGIDPLEVQLKVSLSNWVAIRNTYDQVLMEMHVHDPSDLTFFKPAYAAIRNYVESGDYKTIDLNVPTSVIDSVLESIRKKERKIRRMQKLVDVPYPYNASDDVVEGIYFLHTYINKSKTSDTLEELEEFVRSRTVEDYRSSAYHNKAWEKHIVDVFDWAYENNLSVSELKSSCKKILKREEAIRYLESPY